MKGALLRCLWLWEQLQLRFAEVPLKTDMPQNSLKAQEKSVYPRGPPPAKAAPKSIHSLALQTGWAGLHWLPALRQGSLGQKAGAKCSRMKHPQATPAHSCLRKQCPKQECRLRGFELENKGWWICTIYTDIWSESLLYPPNKYW